MKLVRDKIPKIIELANREPVTHIAEDKEYWIQLKNKLIEEVNEFLESEEKEELADINEVILAIMAFKQISPSELEDIRKTKNEKRGSFSKRIILDEVKK